MKEIEITWKDNGFYYLWCGGRVIYKSKDANKVNSRYESMLKMKSLYKAKEGPKDASSTHLSD